MAGSLMLALTALAVPRLFHVRAQQAFTALSPDVIAHLEEGFEDAVLVAGHPATASLLTALAASWLLAQRLSRPIGSLADAARRVGVSGYHARVPIPASSDELVTLARAFNQMARMLESTEAPG